MKYMLLIHQGTTPLPGTDALERPVAGRAGRGLRGLQALNETPGFTPGERMQPPETRDDGPRPGRQDAHDRRPVRRAQGVDRRLRLHRGRRPRRRDRGRREDPRREHGRRDRGAADRRVTATLEQTFREQWGRVLAALIGFLGDFDLAEEAAQEAFAIAAERWPRDGVPSSPGQWLVTTARNRAIDRIRRDRTLRSQDPPARGPAGSWRTAWTRPRSPTSASSSSSPAVTRRSRPRRRSRSRCARSAA